MVFDATDAKQDRLAVVEPAHVTVVVDNDPVVGAGAIVLAGTPPTAVVADI